MILHELSITKGFLERKHGLSITATYLKTKKKVNPGLCMQPYVLEMYL